MQVLEIIKWVFWRFENHKNRQYQNIPSRVAESTKMIKNLLILDQCAQVAVFVSRQFVQQFEANKNYLKKNYELALKQTFLKMDQLLSNAEDRRKHQNDQKIADFISKFSEKAKAKSNRHLRLSKKLQLDNTQSGWISLVIYKTNNYMSTSINHQKFQRFLQEMQNSQQLRPQQLMRQAEQHWKNTFAAIDEFYQAAVTTPASISVFCQKSNTTQLMARLLQSITSNQQYIKDQQKKKACSIIDYFLKQSAKVCSAQTTIVKYFEILFNFKLEHQLKNFFLKSLKNFRVKWCETIGTLFEKAIILSIRLLSSLESESSVGGTYAQILKSENFSEDFTIKIQWPRDRKQAYSTIILIGKVLQQSLEFLPENYASQLANIFRKFTQLVFSKDLVQTQPKLVVDLLDFWKNFLNQDSIFIEDDERQTQKRFYEVLMKICSWEEIYQGCVGVLQLHSPVTYHQDLKSNLCDYLALEEHWESEMIHKLKQASAMLLTEMITLEQYQQNKTSEIYCSQIIWSIIQTLQKLVGLEHRINQEQKVTCMELLHLLKAIVRTQSLLNIQQSQHLFQKILLPIFEFHLQETLLFFRIDVQTFKQHIDDCVDSQNQETILAKITSVIEALTDSNQQLLDHTIEFIISNLMRNRDYMMQHGELQSFAQRKIKNTTGLLLLTLLSFHQDKMYEQAQRLRQIFQVDYLALLSEVEVALIYEYFAYTQPEYYNGLPIFDNLIKSALVLDMDANLRTFAIQMLIGMQTGLWKRSHVEDLVTVYRSIEKMPDIYNLLSLIIQRRIDLFTNEDFVAILDHCSLFLEERFGRVRDAIQNNKHYKPQLIYNYLNVASNIARSIQSIPENTQVSEKLWVLVKMISQVKYVTFDDDLIKIGNHLLDKMPGLPSNIDDIFAEIDIAFDNCEYIGNGYYQFFERLNRKCGLQHQDLIKRNHDKMIEIASIFINYPEEDEENKMTIQNYVSLSNALLVIQSMLQHQVQEFPQFSCDINDTLRQVQQIKVKFEQYPCILARIINLKLSLLNYQDGIQIDYDWILDLANKNSFCAYQAKLLVHSLTTLLPKIEEKDFHILWTIVIYLLRADEKMKTNYGIKKPENQIKFHALLSLIEPPVLVERDLNQQVSIFAKLCKEKNFKNFHISLNMLTQQEYDELNSFLNGDLNRRKLIRLQAKMAQIDTLRKEQSIENKAIVNDTCEKLNSILTFDDQSKWSKIPPRASPFESMQISGQFSDEEQRQLVKKELVLKKRTRIANIEMRKEAFRQKQLNKKNE